MLFLCALWFVFLSSKELPAIGLQVLCLGNFFFMCHWKQQQQHGRWQGRAERRLVRPDPHQFHPEPGWGYWERGRALLCEYTDSQTSHGHKPEANFYFSFSLRPVPRAPSQAAAWPNRHTSWLHGKTQQSVHNCEVTPSYHNVSISVHSSVQVLPAADFCQSVSCTCLLVAGRGNWFSHMSCCFGFHPTLPPRA